MRPQKVFNKGWILNPVPNLIPDSAVLKSVNAEFTKEGGIICRQGMSKQNVTALESIHSHFKSAHRYTGAYTKMYRDLTTTLLTGLSGNKFQFHASQPYVDLKEWTFMTNGEDAGMKKDNGTNIYKWGISPAVTTCAVAVGAAGNPDGDYIYKIVYVNGNTNFESNGSPTASITVVNQKISLSAIPTSSDPQVTKRKIFRFGGTLTTYNLITTLNDNTTTSYTDDTGDSDVGEELVENNDVPPLANKLCEFEGSLFLTGNADYPQRVYKSRRYQPEAWPAEDYIEVGTRSDPPQAVIALQTGVYAVTKTKFYQVMRPGGTNLMNPRPTNSHVGTLAPYSLVATSYGAFFIGSDGQVYVFTGELSKCVSDRGDGTGIAPLFKGETVEGIVGMNINYVDTCHGAFYQNKYYLVYPESPNNTPTKMVTYDALRGRWSQDSRAFNVVANELKREIVGGASDGFLYLFDDGTDGDAGSDIEMDVEFKKYPLSEETALNVLRRYRTDMDTKGDDATLSFELDDTEILSDTLNVTRKNAAVRRSFSGKLMGMLLQPKLSYTGKKQIDF